MANKIILKRTNVQGRIPTTNDLDLGELAINTFDGRFFAKKNDGSLSVIDLKQNDPVRILGDASSTYAWDQSTYTSNVTMTLNTVNSNVGTYGNNTGGVLTVPVITVNDKGLVTSVTTTTFSAAQDLGTMSVQDADSVAITGGTIDNVSIGLGTRSYGGFTEVNTDYGANIGGNLFVNNSAVVSQNLTVSGILYSNDITAVSVTVDGDAVITGNLVIQGTQTTVNSTTVAVGDLNIELAKDATSAAEANGAGITVIGPTTPATFTYNGTNDSWNLNKKLNGVNADFSGSLETNSLSVDTLTSGRITFASTNGLLADDAELTYNSTTNTISVPNLSIGTNVHIVNSLSVDGQATIGNLTITGTTSLSNISTSNALETEIIYGGTNGVFKGESTFTYNESTDTLSVGNASVTGNVAVNGGNLNTSAGTFNLVNSGASTVNFAGAGTIVNIGAAGVGSTLTIKNNSVVLDGDLEVKGGDLTTNQATFNLLNSTATTINLGGSATALNLGAATGTTTVKNDLNVDGNADIDGLLTLSAGDNVNNGLRFTPNAGGGTLDLAYVRYFARSGESTTLEISNANDNDDNINITASGRIGFNTRNPDTDFHVDGNVKLEGTLLVTSSATLQSDLTVDGDVEIKGGDLTTNQTTFNLLNSNATTINFGGAATTVEIGATSGTTTINNNAQVDGTLAVTGNLSINTNKFNVVASTGDTTIDGALIVQNSATLNDTLAVNDFATFNDGVGLTANILYTFGNYTSGTMYITGDQSIGGRLQVEGAIYKGGYEVINVMDTIDGGTY